jgi:hypothetical protein
LAYNLNITTKFSNNGNNYKGSLLEKACEDWFENTNFHAVARVVDLRAANGDSDYGPINAKVAPLTFDEWRNYQKIITPVLSNWIWTVTPWSNSDGSTGLCSVNTIGSAYYSRYNNSDGLAPAFILDSSFYNNFDDLSDISTEALLEELHKRACPSR